MAFIELLGLVNAFFVVCDIISLLVFSCRILSGYENKNESDYHHYLYRNDDLKFERIDLPVPQFPASVVRPCDFDHDGFTDLFIGARVKPGMYPYSNHSWLIHNENGNLVTDSVFRLNLGLVTDAIWTDYDGDGWEDLFVAREWNSLVILKNVNGKEFVPQYIPTLESKHGFWYSIVEGDFDMDGDNDYIAGNLGNNHRFPVSDSYPLILYVIDLEPDGIIDPLVTACWPDPQGKMTRYPVNYLDELWSQSLFFRIKYKDYSTFSHAGFDDMINQTMLKRKEFELKVNGTSSYILWNDKGTFTFEQLPDPVQEAPVTKMIVHDFNGDKWPDVLIGGNDYTYDLSTGYFDANKGLVLLNNINKRKEGGPAFIPLMASESGLALKGMIESLLIIEGDSSYVIAGINRDRASVYRLKLK